MNAFNARRATLISGFLTGAIVIAVVASGIAGASTPTSSTITTCRVVKTGAVRVINPAKQKCGKGEVALAWTSSGVVGTTGVRGATGLAGAAGVAGADGAKGGAGPKGLTGNQGAPGPTGAPGARGPAGPSGAAGAKGATGDTGAGFVYGQGTANPQADIYGHVTQPLVINVVAQNATTCSVRLSHYGATGVVSLDSQSYSDLGRISINTTLNPGEFIYPLTNNARGYWHARIAMNGEYWWFELWVNTTGTSTCKYWYRYEYQ